MECEIIYWAFTILPSPVPPPPPATAPKPAPSPKLQNVPACVS